MQPTKLATFWATWKLRIIAGVAVLAALAIAIYASHTVGYNKGKNLSEVEIVKYERELAKVRADQAVAQGKVDTRVVTQYVTKIAYQDKIVYQNRDIIRTKVVDRPVYQTVSKGWVYAHNQSALGLPVDPVLAADSTVSGVLDTKILDRIADNYRIGQNGITLAESLQDWIRSTEAAKNEVNKK